MKIALVHEFLTQLGGAERVLENFLEIWPDATIHVLIYDKNKTNRIFEEYSKKISYLNLFPLAHSHHKLLLPFMPGAIEGFKFDDYDMVLSDSSSFAHGVKTGDRLHICYCHTPARFLWTEAKEYLETQPYPIFLKWSGRPLLGLLRRWDFKSAQRPHFYIANSKNVQNRIKKYYARDSVVIPPPVDTEKFYPDGEKQDYFLVAGRLEPYKKTNLVVEAFNQLGMPLKVVGSGNDLIMIKSKAGKNIEFLGRVSDEELRSLYSGAKAFIFPQEEDAGIMPLEAMACGTPLIAYRAGGALETVIERKTGVFFDEQTVESLKRAIEHYDTGMYNGVKLREHAMKFDKKIFQKKIKEFVETQYANRA